MRCLLESVLVGLLIATPTLAHAQAVTTFDALALRLDLGDRAEVGLRNGAVISGRVVGLTSDAIQIESPAGRREVVANDVESVATRGDGLRNGTVYGFLGGAAFGALFASTFSGEFRGGDMMSGILIFGSLGAGLGVGFDALIDGTTVVYRAGRARASVVPILSPRTLGLGASISW